METVTNLYTTLTEWWPLIAGILTVAMFVLRMRAKSVGDKSHKIASALAAVVDSVNEWTAAADYGAQAQNDLVRVRAETPEDKRKDLALSPEAIASINVANMGIKPLVAKRISVGADELDQIIASVEAQANEKDRRAKYANVATSVIGMATRFLPFRSS